MRGIVLVFYGGGPQGALKLDGNVVLLMPDPVQMKQILTVKISPKTRFQYRGSKQFGFFKKSVLGAKLVSNGHKHCIKYYY